MSIHRLQPHLVAELIARHRRRSARLLPLGAGALLLSIGLGVGKGTDFHWEQVPRTVPFIALGLAALLVWLMVRALRAQREQLVRHLESYALTLGEDTVSHRSATLSEQRLTRAELARVEESPTLGLRLHSRDQDTPFTVPRQLQGYDVVRATLLGWRNP